MRGVVPADAPRGKAPISGALPRHGLAACVGDMSDMRFGTSKPSE
jgi:hypothetical protein